MAYLQIRELESKEILYFGKLITDIFGMLVLPRSVNRKENKIYVYEVFNGRRRAKNWKRKYR